MSIYEYNEEYVKKTIYEDALTEGKVTVRAAMIASIKKMHSKGFSSEEIADLLDQEKEAVEQILELIEEDPHADNLTIARKAIERESQTEKAGIHTVKD